MPPTTDMTHYDTHARKLKQLSKKEWVSMNSDKPIEFIFKSHDLLNEDDVIINK